ncbi:hypothetical protein [Pinirhizobacter soli]|uniref:hypothetical protein n=1 Tax=Pinirhizobacter soli TaxID=2786953 RepID=UPI002029E998|nr:hypothetical protein [Pinirhizobacter soli]
MTDDSQRGAIAFSRAWMEFLKNFLTVSAYAISAAVVARHPEWFGSHLIPTAVAAITLYLASLLASTATGRIFVDALSDRFIWARRILTRTLLNIVLLILGAAVAVLAFNTVH